MYGTWYSNIFITHINILIWYTFQAYPDTIDEPSLYLIGTNQYKYRFILKSNLTCIKTIQAPLLRSPVVNFQVLPHLNCALIVSHSEVGVQKLPLSGLPHDYIYFTLPKSTGKIYFTPNREYILSIGGQDSDCLRVWKINPAMIRTHNPSFRHELERYYSLINGGYGGDEFGKIENTFVYFTIQGACQDFVNKQVSEGQLQSLRLGEGYVSSWFVWLTLRG
ncbi:hypothetical protein WDU94_007546 [Cyamophila willieti]